MDDPLPADQMILYIAGDNGKGFQASAGSQIRATVFAPHSSIWLGPNGSYEGAFIGEEGTGAGRLRNPHLELVCQAVKHA